jgi:hypothetical protein
MKYIIHILTFTALLLSGCYTKSINGRVIDQETGRPLENTYIIATWESKYITPDGYHNATVAEVKHTVTDINGSFHIPGWFYFVVMPLKFIDEPEIVLIKPGYVPLQYSDLGSINYMITGYDGRVLLKNESDNFGKRNPAVGAWLQKVGEYMQIVNTQEEIEKDIWESAVKRNEIDAYLKKRNEEIKRTIKIKERLEIYYWGMFKMSKLHAAESELDKVYNLNKYLSTETIDHLDKSFLDDIHADLQTLK